MPVHECGSEAAQSHGGVDVHRRTFAVAPMMEWTDRHCRVFHRAFTRRARLYTEMVTVGAVLHGPRDKLLGFSPVEHPIAVQLGGSRPSDLARAARIAEDFGFDEVNLNVGCPSSRVQGGQFGACLMREPRLVGDCVAAMKAAVRASVTVKCRIGVDEQDPEEALDNLAAATVAAGVDGLVVHARKAWLSGLNPKENRDVPPLDYGRVYRLKARYPHGSISINGGIETIAAAREHLQHVDGVMMGRAAYQNPELLGSVDPLLGWAAPAGDGFEALEIFRPYVAANLARGERLQAMTRHLLGLFAGQPGARAWRRHLATRAPQPGAGLEVLDEALRHVRRPAMAA